MATGIPGRNGHKKAPYKLEYPNKKEARKILASPASTFELALSIPGTPKNRMYFGENLAVLRGLCNDPAVMRKVRLIYIDPPYASGSRFESRKQEHAYIDFLDGANYLEFLRERLLVMRELLSEDGSIYLHLDGRMAFPAKVLMDEIFGADKFRNFITRKKSNRKNYTRRQFGNVSDYILFYTKSNEWIWNQPFEEWTEEWALREYPYVEEGTGRRYKKVPVHAPGERKGETGQAWRGKLPPRGKHWQYLPSKLDEMDRRGEIYWSPTGNPRRKIYLDESKGVPFQDMWTGFRDAHNQMVKVTGYPTEKNLSMLKLIVSASSKPGDLVLDAFGGSGTTSVAAEEEARQWIWIDNSQLAVETTIRRLAQGSQPMGDFVVGKKRPEASLFADPVLKSGLDLFLSKEPKFAAPTPQELNEWHKLFSSSATP